MHVSTTQEQRTLNTERFVSLDSPVPTTRSPPQTTTDHNNPITVLLLLPILPLAVVRIPCRETRYTGVTSPKTQQKMVHKHRAQKKKSRVCLSSSRLFYAHTGSPAPVYSIRTPVVASNKSNQVPKFRVPRPRLPRSQSSGGKNTNHTSTTY